MRNNLFRGVTTAMITPFLPDGSVNYDGLRKNTRHQLDNGISGLLPLGTTGETPTLTENEKEKSANFPLKMLASELLRGIIAGSLQLAGPGVGQRT